MKRLVWIFFLPLMSLFAAEPISLPTGTVLLGFEAFDRRPAHQNWLFSPLSASSCLSMLYTGSNHNTATELSTALYFDLPQDEVGSAFYSLSLDLLHKPVNEKDITLTMAQGIWVQQDFPLLDTFLFSMQHNFLAEIDMIDFSTDSVNKINSSIASKTEQKIKNLLSPSDIDAKTRLVIASSIYFKGSWIQPFDPKNTCLDTFTSSNGAVQKVSMMHEHLFLPYFENEKLQAVFLPFANDSCIAKPACFLILPKTTAPLSLSINDLAQIVSGFTFKSFYITLPKFNFEKSLDMNDLLTQLGVQDAFTPKADFSGMDGRLDLYLSKVVQKCFFSFEENGAEGAAATGAVMNVACAYRQNELAFTANRPFEFLLYDCNSGTCLMIGHVETPK